MDRPGLNGSATAWMVDCHSHVLPSGDDGAANLEEGRALCVEAARRGTAVLFATPHIWPHLKLTPERETAISGAMRELRPRAGLDLRLGYELTPCPLLLREDPARYELEGTGCVLVEVPFTGGVDLLVRVAEHIESHGLRPVIAHPERTEAVAADPRIVRRFAARGWALQVNATSLIGHHGPAIESLAWRLLDKGLIALVGSDGHRWTRPALLDGAWELVSERYGNGAAHLFDGSALGFGQAAVAPRRVAGQRA
jgi:protein-tyrosine phosphatase